MEPVIGKNEKNAAKLVHIQQHKRKRSNSDTSLSLESEDTTDEKPTRAIGTDGHYYACIKCDNGGELLCCDSCACTYHLECLDPPLDSIPEGHWHCPNCDHVDPSELIANYKRRHSNSKGDASYNCSLCAKTKKILELSEDECDKPKSLEINSEEENLPADTDKDPMENQEGTSVCNVDSCETSTQKFPNNKPDKLLILREVLLESMKDLDKSKQQNNEKTNAVPDSAAEDTQAALTWKEKYAMLRTRQKERICVEALSNLRSMAQKQSSELQDFSYREGAPSRALPYRWGGALALLSSMSLTGQNTTMSNTSLLARFSSTTMGVPLSFNTDTSFDANADSMVIVPTPTGLLKIKTPTIAWSENELDALWVGIRRYGAGNWDVILGDPSLNCLKNKTRENLSVRWKKELRKFWHPGLISTVPSRSAPPLNAYSFSMRHASSSFSTITNKEPMIEDLLLGGYFPLPNSRLKQNMDTDHSSGKTQTLPKPVPPVLVVDDDNDDDN